jgi:hypothetical protein
MSLAIAVAGATGAYIVWLHLKSPSYLFTTEWGTRFLVLAAFAAAFLALRLYNQVIVDKSIVADSVVPQKGLRKDAASSWQFSIPAEMCVGIAVLFVTSQLIITTPPYPTERVSLEKRAVSQGATIVFSVHPVEPKQFLVTVTDDKTRAEIPVTEIVVTLQNAEKNIGPLVVEPEQRFVGGFTFPRDSLSIPGQWTIDITARRPDSYDAVASFQLDYPREIDSSRVGADERHLGPFEALAAIIALASILFAAVLYRFSSQLHSQTADIETRRGLSNSEFTWIKSFAAGLVTTTVVSLLVWVAYHTLFRTGFQKLCEANNGVWTQSPPMTAGVVSSSSIIMGCTAGAGAYHFVDVREYSYFLKKPKAPEHHHH